MENKIFDESILVIVSDSNIDIYDSLKEEFNNIIIASDKYSTDGFIESINNSKISKIYLAGNHSFYQFLLPRLKNKIEVCWIYSNSFSSLSDIFIRADFSVIYDYYDRGYVKSIGCIKEEFQSVFKNAGYRCELLNLVKKQDVLNTNNSNSNSIGIISNDHDPRNNFYNQLASLVLVDYDFCKCIVKKKATKKFADFFKVKIEKKNNINDVIKNNFVNLYVNFTNTNDRYIIESFKLGVPVLVGNTTFFQKSKYLQEHLVVKSGDSVDEISNKIKFVKENYNKILEEYKNL